MPDVAPNTFLAAGGTAANATRLGILSARDYLLGNGRKFVNRVQVPVGQSALIVSFSYGDLVGKCASGGVPQTEYVSHTSPVDLVDWVTDYGSPTGTTAIHTTNGLTNGGTYIESHSTVVPQAITWQAAFDNGTPHVTTAWTTGQNIGTTSCHLHRPGVLDELTATNGPVHRRTGRGRIGFSGTGGVPGRPIRR